MTGAGSIPVSRNRSQASRASPPAELGIDERLVARLLSGMCRPHAASDAFAKTELVQDDLPTIPAEQISYLDPEHTGRGQQYAIARWGTTCFPCSIQYSNSRLHPGPHGSRRAATPRPSP